MWRTMRRSSPPLSGSLFTKRSPSRMTPSLKLFARCTAVAVPSVISVLPPPMSITTTLPAPTSMPCTAARWMSDASSTPVMTRAWIPVCAATASRKSPPLGASLTALVATATMSSTCRESARRLNRDSVCSAAVMAPSPSGRPSRPPAPRRTMSFSRPTTSKAPSAATRTRIM